MLLGWLPTFRGDSCFNNFTSLLKATNTNLELTEDPTHGIIYSYFPFIGKLLLHGNTDVSRNCFAFWEAVWDYQIYIALFFISRVRLSYNSKHEILYQTFKGAMCKIKSAASPLTRWETRLGPHWIFKQVQFSMHNNWVGPLKQA